MTYELDESRSSKNFTPAENVLATFGVPRNIQYLTVHWWGAYGQDFDQVVDFLCTNNSPTSAHFVAEGGRVACIVSPEDAAWHAGNAYGNATSIGVECKPEGDDDTYETVSELIAWIRSVYGNLPLVPHNHWTSTSCPGTYDLARLDARARELAAGAAPLSNDTTPIEEDPLAAFTEADIRRFIREETLDAPVKLSNDSKNTTARTKVAYQAQLFAEAEARDAAQDKAIAALDAKLDAILAAVAAK